MDTQLIYILIALFWIWSIETLYIEMRQHKDYLSYTNFNKEKLINDIQLKYLYINLYLSLLK